MGESYFDTENASRIILLYPHIPSLDSWNRGQRLTDYCTLQGHASQVPLPAILGSLRGSAPQRGSRGPLSQTLFFCKRVMKEKRAHLGQGGEEQNLRSSHQAEKLYLFGGQSQWMHLVYSGRTGRSNSKSSCQESMGIRRKRWPFSYWESSCRAAP